MVGKLVGVGGRMGGVKASIADWRSINWLVAGVLPSSQLANATHREWHCRSAVKRGIFESRTQPASRMFIWWGLVAVAIPRPGRDNWHGSPQFGRNSVGVLEKAEPQRHRYVAHHTASSQTEHRRRHHTKRSGRRSQAGEEAETQVCSVNTRL